MIDFRLREAQETFIDTMAVQGMTDSLDAMDLKEKTSDYRKLIDYGLDSKVADKLDDIYKVNINFECLRRSENFLKIVFGRRKS